MPTIMIPKDKFAAAKRKAKKFGWEFVVPSTLPTGQTGLCALKMIDIAGTPSAELWTTCYFKSLKDKTPKLFVLANVMNDIKALESKFFNNKF